MWSTSFHLYDSEAASVLAHITLAADELKTKKTATTHHTISSDNVVSKDTILQPDVTDIDLSISDKMFCSYCNSDFTDREEQTSHYRSDWHRFNLKLKLRDERPVTLDEFEEIAGDISSISGSDSEDDSRFTICETHIPLDAALLSDDDDDDDGLSYHVEGIGRNHPQVFVRHQNGELMSLYRSLLHSRKSSPETSEELVAMISKIPQQTTWAVIMSAGGHFAAAIFKKGEVIVHKTFHRYVVRAKRGTAQSIHDKQGGFAKSGGATLRRYNEAALKADILETLHSWRIQLAACDRIFTRCPESNRNLFYGCHGNSRTPAIDKRDPKLRVIPFPTRRPTFSEVKHVHQKLTTVHKHGTKAQLTDFVGAAEHKPKTSPRKQKSNNKDCSDSSSSDSEDEVTARLTSLKLSDNSVPLSKRDERRMKKHKKKKVPEKDNVNVEETVMKKERSKLCNDLYIMCQYNNHEELHKVLSQITNPPTPTEADGPENVDVPLLVATLQETVNEDEQTLLHIAAQRGHARIIEILLEAGVDPVFPDVNAKVCYDLSANKNTRDIFRKFMAEHPDRYDYKAAKIPLPLTDDMVMKQKLKEQARRKAAERAKKERLKVRQAEEETIKVRQADIQKQQSIVRAEEQQKQNFLKLSDREKRALAAERRMVTQASEQGQSTPVLCRCWFCGADMTGKVPFEYYDYKFCSSKCLKGHKLGNKKPTPT